MQNQTRLLRHLDTEERTNASPFGLHILSGRRTTEDEAEGAARWKTVQDSLSQISPARWEALEAARLSSIAGSIDNRRSGGHSYGYGLTEGDIWMMAPADHATLLIRNGRDVAHALSQAERPYRQMRTVLKDMWNTPGVLNGVTGMPYLTSHYGYHMTIWHLPLALSGQDADLPNGRLSFAPAIPAPYQLPLFLPGVWGTIAATKDGQCTVVVTAGSLVLSRLEISGRVFPGTAVLEPGRPLVWRALLCAPRAGISPQSCA